VAVRPPDWRLVGGAFDQGSGGGGDEIAEIPIGTKNGSNTVFTLTYSPTQYPVIWLELNGVFQEPDVDFTLTGNTITYTFAPASTDRHFIIYHIGLASPRAPGTARGFGANLGVSSGDVLYWGNAAAFKITGDMAWGSWVKVRTTGMVVFQGNNANSGSAENDLFEFLTKSATGGFVVSYNHENGSASQNRHDFSHVFPLNTWMYLGFTRDSATKNLYLYAGTATPSLIDMFAFANNADGGQDSSTGLSVGNGHPNLSDVLDGAIKEHYLWDRTLTLDEHIAAANGNPSLSGMVVGSCMGNDPENDISGNGHSGTVTGTLLVTGH